MKTLASAGLVALAAGALCLGYFRPERAPAADARTRTEAPADRRAARAPAATAPRYEIARQPSAPPQEGRSETAREADAAEADRATELGVTLRTAFDLEPPGDATALGRTRRLREVFDAPVVREKGGQLGAVSCTRSMCRGEITLESERSDREVFGETFLSASFAREFPGAVAVPEREVLPGGRVRAVFFLYDDGVLEGLPN